MRLLKLTHKVLVLFIELKKIPKGSHIFQQMAKKRVFFSYFLAYLKYYLFLYSKKVIRSRMTIYLKGFSKCVTILKELNAKQPRLRSLRGFFVYAIRIIVKLWFQGKILKCYKRRLNICFGKD